MMKHWGVWFEGVYWIAAIDSHMLHHRYGCGILGMGVGILLHPWQLVYLKMACKHSPFLSWEHRNSMHSLSCQIVVKQDERIGCFRYRAAITICLHYWFICKVFSTLVVGSIKCQNWVKCLSHFSRSPRWSIYISLFQPKIDSCIWYKKETSWKLPYFRVGNTFIKNELNN